MERMEPYALVYRRCDGEVVLALTSGLAPLEPSIPLSMFTIVMHGCNVLEALPDGESTVKELSFTLTSIMQAIKFNLHMGVVKALLCKIRRS